MSLSETSLNSNTNMRGENLFLKSISSSIKNKIRRYDSDSALKNLIISTCDDKNGYDGKSFTTSKIF